MASPKKEILPLHSSVEHRIISKIRTLLPATQDLNKKNDKGYTPFLLACEQSNEDIFDLLLTQRGIDISVATDEGFSALHILAFRGNLRGVRKVMEWFPNVDIEVATKKGNTPLIEACKENHTAVAEYLLEKGADVRHYNYDKAYTALHYTACYGHKECLELLLKYGPNINAKDNYGNTPLMKAASWGFADICKTLIVNGANVNTFSRDRTPLSSSCLYDKPDVANLLIAHGAEVNLPGPFSIALIECAKKGSMECAKVLIEAGVDINGIHPSGKNALDFARVYNQQNMVDLLSRFQD